MWFRNELSSLAEVSLYTPHPEVSYFAISIYWSHTTFNPINSSPRITSSSKLFPYPLFLTEVMSPNHALTCSLSLSYWLHNDTQRYASKKKHRLFFTFSCFIAGVAQMVVIWILPPSEIRMVRRFRDIYWLYLQGGWFSSADILGGWSISILL